MSQLINKTTEQTLALHVIKAQGIFSRLKGLIGEKDFPLSSAFWIIPCQGGIHTFFMQFPIDVIFVSRSLCVINVLKNIKPWRMAHPAFFSLTKTYSVFEFKTPALSQYHLQKGDNLYVGH